MAAEELMMKTRYALLVLMCILLSLPLGGLAADNYAVKKEVIEGHTTYHLLDSKLKMDVGIVPDIGNLAYQFKVNGKDVLIPVESFQDYLEKHTFGWGIPFLAPWANRIDNDCYYFEGKKYLLNDSLGNVIRDDSKQPLHGLLVYETRWKVVKTGSSDVDGAFIVSRLEFYKYPDLMAQFPFAQVYEMTYRLKDGKLECVTQVTNLSNSNLPVHFAFHPYFHPDGPREQWKLTISAQKHWIVTKQLIPTGETEPTDKFLPGVTKGVALDQTFIDDGFSEFRRGANGLGQVLIQGKTQKIEVQYGKGFDYAIVYAPLNKTLICAEPQTGPTNAFNLQHAGKFKNLIILAPGETFEASFWIAPIGF
jgi:aldose 1-epimerase